MTESDVRRFKAILERKMVEVATAFRNRDAIAVEKSAEEFEALQRATERDLAIANFNRGAAVFRSIRAALRRVEDGSFGACMHCGAQISRKRLEAVPWAALCLHCQEAADRGEGRGFENTDESLVA